MKGNSIITPLLVLLCFAMYVAIELKLPCKEGESECGANTKRLQAQNDSLTGKNRKLDEKYLSLQKKTDSLQVQLSATKQTIVELKNKQHEKINAIDSLTNDELFGFFSKFNTEAAIRR